VYLLVFHAYINEMRGSRSKIPSKKSCPYIYVKFLALLGASYIYDSSRLRVNYCHVYVIVLFTDINECMEDPPVCSHQCRNVKGSFKCLCPRGYVLLEDGRTCSGMHSCTGYFCLLVCSVHRYVIMSVFI
jgi:hypothetical protein